MTTSNEPELPSTNINDSDPLQIDPNHADEEQLRQLPGIGPELASRIVAGRPYNDAAELALVPGLGGAVLEEIRSSLIFESAGEPVEAEMAEDSEPSLGEEAVNSEAREPDEEDLSELEAQVDSSKLLEPAAVEPRSSPGALAILAIAAATVLCSVSLSLAVLAGINGTLDFGRHSSIQEVRADISSVQSDLEAVQIEVDSLQARTQALEGVSGRMTEVEGQLESLQQQLGAAVDTVEGMQSDLSDVLTETRAQAEQVSRFQTFIERLSQILTEVLGQE